MLNGVDDTFEQSVYPHRWKGRKVFHPNCFKARQFVETSLSPSGVTTAYKNKLAQCAQCDGHARMGRLMAYLYI